MALYRLLLRRLTGRPRSPPPTPQAGSAMALYRRAASVIRPRGAPPMLPARAMASLLGHVEPTPKDPILGVTEAFLANPMAGRDPPRCVRPKVEEVAGGDVVVGGAVARC
ncbi:aspartate aminotransferase, mitochondrial-like [Hordeum vulgare]|nr:aspartate aminotransferase, mitochondrial-like [Hordeum vulgare]